MRCKLCKAKTKYEFCDKCFPKVIERRVRRYTRLNKLFKKGDVLFVEGRIAKFFIPRILEGLPVKIVHSKSKAKKIVTDDTADSLIEEFLSELVFKKRKLKKYRKREKQVRIPLLVPITDKEARRFARLKRIKYIPPKRNKQIGSLLAELEHSTPDIRYKLLRTIKKLKGIL